MLKGKKPEIKEKRLKLFVYGTANVGKTTAAIQFPNAYIIDTEKGTDFYADTINKMGSVVFQSSNPDEIRDEVKELLTTKHDYRTLIIDPMTQVYNSIQDKWTRIFMESVKDKPDANTQDFGMRYWGKVKSEMKAIQRLILALDMNVIVSSHQKDVYGTNFSKIGVTFDSMKGDDYLFDLIFQIEKKGKDRIAKTVKERAEVGKAKFPEEFTWSYDNFCQYYGKEVIERKSTPMVMASKEQIEKLTTLLTVVRIDPETVEKWKNKADADTWDEFTGTQIQACIDYMEKQIKGVK